MLLKTMPTPMATSVFYNLRKIASTSKLWNTWNAKNETYETLEFQGANSESSWRVFEELVF